MRKAIIIGLLVMLTGCVAPSPVPRIYSVGGGASGGDRFMANRFVVRQLGSVFIDGQNKELLLLIDIQGRRHYLLTSGIEVTPLAPINELQEVPRELR